MNVSDLPAQIAKKIAVDPTTGCWVWTAAKDHHGYARIRIDNVGYRAHRVTYHLLRDATLPMRGTYARSLDHVVDRCATGPSCVNPAHLDEVTHRENVARGRRSVRAETRSQFVGVVRAADGIMQAQIQIDGRTRYLGRGTEGHCAHLADAGYMLRGDKPLNFTMGLVDRPPTISEIAMVRCRLAAQDRRRQRLALVQSLRSAA